MMTYRVRLFSGPNGSSATGACGHGHETMLGALRCARSHISRGKGVMLQGRLFKGEPWVPYSPAYTDKWAAEHEIQGWQKLSGA